LFIFADEEIKSILKSYHIMNKNEKFIITINRELGSGGRTVGSKLAEKLGVEFFDKAVIKGLQEKFHLSVYDIEKLKGAKQNWWTELKRQLIIGPGSANYYIPRDDDVQPLDTDTVFKVETEILKSIAAEESCVVAGRSGFFVLRDCPNRLSIFIRASMPFRLARVMRKQHVTEDEARKIIERVDTMRENYVKKYAKTSRYDTRNYDLIISVDGKTEDEIVDMILKYIG
jgi:cytidylate kinase